MHCPYSGGIRACRSPFLSSSYPSYSFRSARSSCATCGDCIFRKGKPPGPICQCRLPPRVARKNLPLRLSNVFFRPALSACPGHLQKQKNNPCGRKQAEQRERKKTTVQVMAGLTTLPQNIFNLCYTFTPSDASAKTARSSREHTLIHRF